MQLRSLVALLLASIWVAIAQANAADIRLLAAPSTDGLVRQPVLLDGLIDDGDLAKLIKLKGERDVKVMFNSRGGSFAEAIKIASFLNEERIPSEIGSGAACYSACAIAFLGGSDHGPEGSMTISRKLHPNGRLGFHAPYLEVRDESYRKEVVEAAYQLAITNVAELVKLSRTIGIDAKVLPLLLEKGNKEFYEIDRVDRAGMFKVEIASDIKLSRFSARMLFNYCRNGYAWGSNNFEPELLKNFVESSDHPLNRSVSFQNALDGKEPNIAFQVRVLPRSSSDGYERTNVALSIAHTEQEGIPEVQVCAIAIEKRADDQANVYCVGVYSVDPKRGLPHVLRLMEAHARNDESGRPGAMCYLPAGNYAYLPADTPLSEVPNLLDLYLKRMDAERGADAPVNK
jgi:hypothetical protein